MAGCATSARRSKSRIQREHYRWKVGSGRIRLEALTAYRDRLNAYAAAVNTPIGESGCTPYRAYGEALAAAGRMDEDRPPILVERTGWVDWSTAHYGERVRILKDLETLIETMGTPVDHASWSSCRTTFLPRDRARLLQLCEALEGELDAVRRRLEALANTRDA